ncbi:MAG: hypothetical protein ACXWVI_00690 [Methyloceanibacter sp.]
MSRMTLLDGSLWLSLAAPRAVSSGKPDAGYPPYDAGYPPYNVELLPGNESESGTLRITLAVAGFGVNELEVSVESGALTVRGKQHDDATRDYLPRAGGAAVQADLSACERRRGAAGRAQ